MGNVAPIVKERFSIAPLQEAASYHDTDRHGFFSLLVVNEKGVKKQTSYPLSHMPEILNQLDPRRDTWLSQAEFVKPNRRVVNLLRVGLLFADLDTYNTPWAAGRTPDQLADSVLFFCRDEGVSAPSILVFSGRGIQAKWLLEGALPRQALPRWNLCQKKLVERLAVAGADPLAKDASRVLRLVETVNSKSGEVCRVVHVTAGADGLPIRYNFELLAQELLPVARWDIEAAQREREENSSKQELKVIRGEKSGNLRSFSGRELAWHRLEDLRKLGQLRGGVREGERMLHLFWRLNFMLLSGATHSSQMYYEAAALAREIDPKWLNYSPELMTLYHKAKAYNAGEKVEFNGKKYSPLYTPKNDSLINLFSITDDEQRQLQTIISTNIAAERHRNREQTRRRNTGAIERTEYLSVAKERAEQARELAALGFSRAEIADKLSLSERTLRNFLNR